MKVEVEAMCSVGGLIFVCIILEACDPLPRTYALCRSPREPAAVLVH